MNENEIFENNDAPLASKTGKPKREISPEQRAQMLENLRIGREKAKLNRQKRGLAKKLEKQEEKKKIDETLARHNVVMELHKENSMDQSSILNEIKQLKEQLSAFTSEKQKKEANNEIEELRKELASLRQSKPAENKAPPVQKPAVAPPVHNSPPAPAKQPAPQPVAPQAPQPTVYYTFPRPPWN